MRGGRYGRAMKNEWVARQKLEKEWKQLGIAGKGRWCTAAEDEWSHPTYPIGYPERGVLRKRETIKNKSRGADEGEGQLEAILPVSGVLGE
jgi:hypothetical protein